MEMKLPDIKDLIKKSYKPDCNYCQETINKIHEDKLDSYHSLILIKPDYNSCGIITHYHIVDFKNPEELKDKIDFMIWCYHQAVEELENRKL